MSSSVIDDHLRKKFFLTCQVSSVQEASSSGHRNRSRLRKVVKAILYWTYDHAMMAVILLGLIALALTMMLMMHLRRVRVGPMKVKVPPCTIGSRHPKVLWWELFRAKLFQLQWSNEATMWIVTPVGRWQVQIQRELCTEYNSEQGRPPWWRQWWW